MSEHKGLKSLRESHFPCPVDPNKYWKRSPKNICEKCGLRVRSKNHEDGPHHKGKFVKVAKTTRWR